MKLEIIRQFFGTDQTRKDRRVGKIGPCALCKYLRRAGKTRYCHMGPLDMQYVLKYTNETGEYYGCEDFTLRNRKKRIKLL